MHNDKNSAGLTLEERRRELSSILARGMLRLRGQLRWASDAAEKDPANSEDEGLEVSPDTVLSVTNPVNGPESPKPGATA